MSRRGHTANRAWFDEPARPDVGVMSAASYTREQALADLQALYDQVPGVSAGTSGLGASPARAKTTAGSFGASPPATGVQERLA